MSDPKLQTTGFPTSAPGSGGGTKGGFWNPNPQKKSFGGNGLLMDPSSVQQYRNNIHDFSTGYLGQVDGLGAERGGAAAYDPLNLALGRAMEGRSKELADQEAKKRQLAIPEMPQGLKGGWSL